jgi:hypothetical protein
MSKSEATVNASGELGPEIVGTQYQQLELIQGTTVATAISISVSLTSVPPEGTTISTSAALTIAIAPLETSAPSPLSTPTPNLPTTVAPAATPLTTTAPIAAPPLQRIPPGICVLFFVPLSGNLSVCPAGKVSLQFPSPMIGSNRYGGLGPCANYPDGAVGFPLLDQQFAPFGL